MDEQIQPKGFERKKKAFHSIRADAYELHHMPYHDASDAFPPLFFEHHRCRHHQYRHMLASQYPLAHQHTLGRLWHVHRRLAIIQFLVSFQSCLVAMRFHFTGRYSGYSTHFLPSTHFVGNNSWICGRTVLQYHWNFVYLKKNNINP